MGAQYLEMYIREELLLNLKIKNTLHLKYLKKKSFSLQNVLSLMHVYS